MGTRVALEQCLDSFITVRTVKTELLCLYGIKQLDVFRRLQKMW